MALSNEEIIDTISNLSVIDVLELVRMMEDRFGISAVAVAMPVATDVAAGEGDNVVAEVEQTEFKVKLVAIGDKKITVIKVVKDITGLGLKESKAVVDKSAGEKSPVIKEGIDKEEAEGYKKRLEEAGATAEIV